MINIFCNHLIIVLFSGICLFLTVFFLAYYTWKDRQNHMKSMDNPTNRELQTLPPYRVFVKVSINS